MTYPRELTNPAQANWPPILNDNGQAVAPAAMYGKKTLTTTGLTLGYFGGHIAGTLIADGTVALTLSATNYVVAHRTTGAVTAATNTTNWNDNTVYGRLGIATATASAFTYVDWREQTGGWFDRVAAGGGADMVLASVQTVTGAKTFNDTTLKLAGSASGAITLAAPAAAGSGTVTFPASGTLATTAEVAAAVAGLSWKQAVRAATTAALTLASDFENGDAIDGVVLATGDRILVKNQASATENGIYVVAASGAPTRATDADSGAELVNASVYVSEGTLLADTQWTCSTNATITVGATNIAFVQLSTGGTPGGSDTHVQYNDGGAFGGEAAFTYDKTNNRLAVQVIKAGDGTTYDANKPAGEDPHWIELVNNPSAGAGKQFFRMVGYAGNSGYGNNMHFERADGTEAAPTAVPDVCYLFSAGFRGYDGAAMSASAAAFQVITTEAWDGSGHGCKFRWEVTPNNSTTRGLGMELTSTGLAVTGTMSSTGAVSGSNLSGTNTGDSASAAVSQTTEMISGYIGTVADKSYKIIVKAAHAGTATETTTISESGTCTATFKINTTAFGGTANSVSSSEQSQAHASANAWSAGDDIVITTSSNSACLGMSFTIKYTRVYS